MTFHQEIFERLLFPLNKEVYNHIQKALDGVGENRINLNISINYEQEDLRIEKLQETKDFKIVFGYSVNKENKSSKSLFNLSFYQKNELNSFCVPLEYLLGYKNQEIMTSYSNFIYSYIFKIDKNIYVYPINKKIKINNEIKSYLYIGRTRQSWLNRNEYHNQDKKIKPHRLIYQALNGNFGEIREKKLVIEKAGLKEYEAIFFEINEIKNRSLNEKFPNGLNMVTGENLYPSYSNIKAS